MLLYAISFSTLFCFVLQAGPHIIAQTRPEIHINPFGHESAGHRGQKSPGLGFTFHFLSGTVTLRVTKGLVEVRFWDLYLQGAVTADTSKQALFEQGHFGSPSS